jgi:excisionase family DNA binding protein
MHNMKETHHNSPNKGWLNLKEASFYIGKPESWMYDNVARINIPHTRLGVQYRFHPSQLDEWMISQQSATFSVSV